MQNPLPHIINQNNFWVSPERILFWEQENTLIVADVHIGKSGHFRQAGIPVPQAVYKEDLQRLMSQIYLYKTDRLIIVGDLSHSKANKELELFTKWRKDFSLLHIDLVKGNHDILHENWYKEANIVTHPKQLLINNFLFEHEANTKEEASFPANTVYTFTGHIHPGIKLKGQAKQSFMFPCFYFGKRNCILPAFSKFTGTYRVIPEKGETVYAITGTEIIKMG
jgi:uncharacterized protein